MIQLMLSPKEAPLQMRGRQGVVPTAGRRRRGGAGRGAAQVPVRQTLAPAPAQAAAAVIKHAN